MTIYFCFLFGFLFDAALSTPCQRMLTLFLFVTLLFFLLSETSMVWVPGHSQQKWLRLVLFFFVGLGLFVAAYRFQGELCLKRIWIARDRGDQQAVLGNCKKAQSVFYNCDPASLPIATYGAAAAYATGHFQLADEYALEAIRLSPYDPQVLNQFAFSEIRKGQFRKADSLLLMAIGIKPCYEPAMENLVLSKYRQADYRGALNWLEKMNNYQIRYARQLQILKEKLDSSKEH